jgi:MOSC domain-containing protein YiiM
MPCVLQVNISSGGVPKWPVERAVLTPLGLQGDSFRNPHIHGGPRQALLLITKEAIDELTAQGFPVFYGALGENLTTEGLDRRTMRAGQRYRIGQEAIIELTKPRGPCATLDVYGPRLRGSVHDKLVKAGDAASPLWGMSGFYAAVVQGGEILPGAPILLIDQVC